MTENQDMPPRKPRADWMAWSLQLLFGCIVGACLGYLVWGRMIRLGLVTIAEWPGIITGTALFVGAITSRRGDRTWFRSSLFDPEPPPQSPASKAASFVIGSYGVLQFGLTLFSHLRRPVSRSESLGLDVALILFGGFIAFLVIHAIRTGIAYTYSDDGPIHREESPFAFCLYVALGTVSVFSILVELFQ